MNRKIAALLLGAILTPTVLAQEILRVDFEEATLGGKIVAMPPAAPGTPPSPATNTTAIAPPVGELGTFLTDDAVIIAGFNGSQKALRMLDRHPARVLRLDARPTQNPASGPLLLAWDARIAPTIKSGNALTIQLVAEQSVIFQFIFRSVDNAFYATNSSKEPAGFPHAFVGPPKHPNGVFEPDVPYRFIVRFDLTALKYDLSIQRIEDKVEVFSEIGRLLVDSPDLKKAGISCVRITAGAPDFVDGAGTDQDGIDIDNLTLTIPQAR